MSSTAAWRMFAAAPVTSATTTFRIGAGCMQSLSQRAPRLWKLGLEAWEPSAAATQASEAFRDELLALAQDYTDVALAELRRGLGDMDGFTRDAPEPRRSPRSGT